MFEGKKILITGGTGSLGQALTKRLLKEKVDTIRIFSRNEEKQIQMESQFNDNRLRFFLGDINDFERLKRALEDIDIVFHTAALKHVPKIEYNPFEAIKTNIIGSQNVINACLHENVEKVIAISTDKAVSPLNTYGATKLLMEKLFVTANNYADPEKHVTRFISVRYGNVLNSRGSIITLIRKYQNEKKDTFSLTDERMTRFFISLEDSVKFVMKSLKEMDKGEIFIPKMPSIKIKELIKAANPKTKIKEVGIRPGEKIDELLISKDESSNTVETNNNFIIFPKNPHVKSSLFKNYKNKKKATSFEYSSKNNKEFLTSKVLSALIKKII